MTEAPPAAAAGLLPTASDGLPFGRLLIAMAALILDASALTARSAASLAWPRSAPMSMRAPLAVPDGIRAASGNRGF